MEKLEEIEKRIANIENFLLAFCTLQLVQQNLVEYTNEERESLELLIATQLEKWKGNW